MCTSHVACSINQDEGGLNLNVAGVPSSSVLGKGNFGKVLLVKQKVRVPTPARCPVWLIFNQEYVKSGAGIPLKVTIIGIFQITFLLPYFVENLALSFRTPKIFSEFRFFYK